ncbi:hypothetical protein AA309_02695, partial [Microvirga vignae]
LEAHLIKGSDAVIGSRHHTSGELATSDGKIATEIVHKVDVRFGSHSEAPLSFKSVCVFRPKGDIRSPPALCQEPSFPAARISAMGT